MTRIKEWVLPLDTDLSIKLGSDLVQEGAADLDAAKEEHGIRAMHSLDHASRSLP